MFASIKESKFYSTAVNSELVSNLASLPGEASRAIKFLPLSREVGLQSFHHETDQCICGEIGSKSRIEASRIMRTDNGNGAG